MVYGIAWYPSQIPSSISSRNNMMIHHDQQYFFLETCNRSYPKSLQLIIIQWRSWQKMKVQLGYLFACRGFIWETTWVTSLRSNNWHGNGCLPLQTSSLKSTHRRQSNFIINPRGEGVHVKLMFLSFQEVHNYPSWIRCACYVLFFFLSRNT